MATPFSFGAPSFSFGQNTTPTTPSMFGAAAPAASPSPFSPAPSTGAFGAPSFGTSTPSFGASTFGSSLTTNTFGAAPSTPFGATASPSPFGATPTSTFGSTTTFGSTQPTTNAFGSSTFGATPTATPAQPSFNFNSLFGATPQAAQQQPKPAFGFGATTAAPSPFGTTPSTATPFSFSSATPASTLGSGTSTGGLFGSTTPTTFGSTTNSTLFSATPSLSFGSAASTPGGLFGAQPTASGTASQKYTPTNETDNSGVASRYHSITAMPVYQAKSFEELRFEDYQAGRKSAQGAGGFSSMSTMGTTPSLFGQTSAPATSAPTTSLFGQPSTSTPSLFSATGTTNNLLGGTSTPSLFNSPSTTSSPFSLTSPTTSTPATSFGSTATANPFPSFSSTTPSPFSSTPAPSTPSFSFSSPSPATQTQTSTPSLFGGTSFNSTSPSTGFFAANTSANKPFNLSSPSPSPSAFSFSSSVPASSTPSLSLFSASPAPAQPQQYIYEASLTSLPFGSLPELNKLSSRGPPEGPSGTPDPKKTAAAPGYKLLPRSAAKLKPRTFGRPNKSLFDSVMDTTQQNDLFVSRSSNIKKLVIDSSAVDSQPLSLPPLSSLTSLPLHEEESASTPSIRKSSEMRGAASPGLQPPTLSPSTASPKSPPRSSASSVSTLKQLEIDDADKPLPKKGVSRYNNYQEAYEKLQSTPSHSLVAVGRASPSSSSSPSPSPASVALDEEKDLVPRLSRAGYFMIPSASEMSNMSERELMSIENFTVGLENIGAVSFVGKTDVRGLDLDEIVFFNPKELIMYPDEQMKPEVGQALNKPAVVSLERCWPSNFHPDDTHHHLTSDILNKFERKLRKITSEWGATFIKYVPSSGTWSFRVNHF